MKINELTGAALDWAVAKCEYDNRRYNYGSPCFSPQTKRVYETQGLQEIGVSFSPSTNWAQGGPIIEREKICVDVGHDGVWLACIRQNYGDLGEHMNAAGNPLIAAMRCYVASKLGDTIDIPEELTGETA